METNSQKNRIIDIVDKSEHLFLMISNYLSKQNISIGDTHQILGLSVVCIAKLCAACGKDEVEKHIFQIKSYMDIADELLKDAEKLLKDSEDVES